MTVGGEPSNHIEVVVTHVTVFPDNYRKESQPCGCIPHYSLLLRILASKPLTVSDSHHTVGSYAIFEYLRL